MGNLVNKYNIEIGYNKYINRCININLPHSCLISINCSNNKLIYLPEIPKTTINLNCYKNKLIALPILEYININFLNCCMNRISNLSRMINFININVNKISGLYYKSSGYFIFYDNPVKFYDYNYLRYIYIKQFRNKNDINSTSDDCLVYNDKSCMTANIFLYTKIYILDMNI